MTESFWQGKTKSLSCQQQGAAHEGGTAADDGDDDELTELPPPRPHTHTHTLKPYWCRGNQIACENNTVHEILCLAFLSLLFKCTDTRTQRASGCVPYLSHVSKMTSSGQWCHVTGTDNVPALRFLVCEESSQGLCWCASDVCVCVCMRDGERRETPWTHGLLLYDVHSLFPHTLRKKKKKTALLRRGFASGP